MNRLARTRSQHFVSSPRKTASPLKHKHAQSRLNPHTTKRRRLATSGLTVVAKSTQLSGGEESEDGAEAYLPAAESSLSQSRRGNPLDAEAGSQKVNRGRAERSGAGVNGKGKAAAMRDVFGSEDDSSPRKRKRGESVQLQVTSESDGDSGSWVEMDEEEEPEFIAESDQHLLEEAPPYALHRLRKSELVRLWKVKGMWNEDDAATTSSTGDEDEKAGLGKKELVDGLIAARKPPSQRLISPLPSPRNSPRRKATLEAAFEMRRLRSATSSLAIASPASSSEGDHRVGGDVDETPRPVPRTRSKSMNRARPRLAENTPSRSVRKMFRRNGYRGGAKGEDARGRRKARFGDDVKSPAHALLERKGRSASASSGFTTTSDSSPQSAQPRTLPRRSRRPSRVNGTTPARRRASLGGGAHRTSSRDNDGADEGEEEPDEEDEEQDGDEDEEENGEDEDVEELMDEDEATEADEDEEEESEEPTPLVARLRSRTKSFQEPAPSEADADDEEEDEEDEDGADAADASPGPSSRTRARDLGLSTGSSGMLLRRDSRVLPRRHAKGKAIEALKGGESPPPRSNDDFDPDEFVEEVEMEEPVASPEAMEDDEEPGSPRSRPLTRSQLRSSQSQLESPRLRGSKQSPIEVSPEPEDVDLDTDATSVEGDDGDDATEKEEDVARMTRSGRAFGMWQSRRKRLRQEAIDDPDMDVEDEDMEDEGEEEEEEDDEAELEIDWENATVASLTRLLRDELVQLCEARNLEVGGTKPQLAKALLEWRNENTDHRSTTSTLSQVTARPTSPAPVASNNSRSTRSRQNTAKGKMIHAIASHVHVPGKTTPVLLRDHIHATDPATPPPSDEQKQEKEAELNLDLAELGLEDSIIKPEHLVRLERIGSGGFKDVYVGKCRGRKVAISEFRGVLSEMDIRELKLLAEFSHPNIVRFRGICIPDEPAKGVPCMLVSELCENGDLFDYIRNVECPSLKRVLGLMLDIARGLEYLHTRNPSIIHRDCKSSNILINRAGQAKVGDFGLARVKTSARSMIRSLVGTVNWQAPELWHPSPRYDYKVDVFSAGMVFWEMMSGWTSDEQKYPWEGYNEHYIYDAVGQKLRRPSVAGLRKHWGVEPVNLMERMWHQDPAERPTMSDVVADLEALIAEA